MSEKTPRPMSAQHHGPRKDGDRGGGLVNSIKNRISRKDDSAAPAQEVPRDAPLYLAGSARTHYGTSTSVLTRERRERGYTEEDFNIGGDHSPFPKPTDDCPFDIIAYIARHMYEKPLDNTPKI